MHDLWAGLLLIGCTGLVIFAALVIGAAFDMGTGEEFRMYFAYAIPFLGCLSLVLAVVGWVGKAATRPAKSGPRDEDAP